MVDLSNNSSRDLRVELGPIWLSPAFQGTSAITETVYLLLGLLFNQGYRRVEWSCDGHNVRARKAAHSLGFSFEGLLRKHMIVKSSNRDTAVFAALNSEWPTIREHLEGKLQKALETQVRTEKKKKI
jgi:RimJ/RimL family protein N-acetyltransferase